MGKRLIRKWICQPLMDRMALELRYNGVDELVGNTVLSGELRELLAGINEIERLKTRIVYGTAGGRALR